MKIIVELLLLAIFGVITFVGVKVGFIKLASKPLKFVLALVFAFTLCSAVGEKIIAPIIEEPVKGRVSDYLEDNCENITGENLDEELPTLIKLAAQAAKIDLEEGVGGGDTIAKLTDKLMDPVVNILSGIIAFFAVLLLSKLLLWILFGFLNSIFKKGAVGKLNSVLGGIFAAFLGFIAAWAFVVIFDFVINIPFVAEIPAVDSFEGGFIYRFLNKYSPLQLLLSF